MARISTYPKDSLPTLNDKVIGTDSDDASITKNYAIGDIIDLANTFTPLFGTAVPNDTTAQEPTGLNTPLKVKFGNGASSSDVIINQFGDITFLTAGTYFFSGIANFGKINGSSQTSKILYRIVLGGTQLGPTKVVDLDKVGYQIPVSLSYALTVEANDIMYFEIMRDSTSDNSGGLYPHAVGEGTWSDVPSTELTIWKLTV